MSVNQLVVDLAQDALVARTPDGIFELQDR
jgi:hypothetical protein